MSCPIGKRRNEFELQSESSVADGRGGWTTTWVTDQRIWGSLRELSSGEVERASQLQYRATHEIGLPYVAGVTSAKRLKLGTRIFRIRRVDNKHQRSVELVLKVEE